MTRRLFLALRPPDAIVHAIADLQWGLGRARWTDPDLLHITVRFLGELPDERAQAIEDGLGDLDLPPLRLQLQGVGHFPSRGAPRALTVGLRDDTALLEVREALDRQLQRLGVPLDRRKLVPHLTVARLGEVRDDDVAEWLSSHGLYRSDPFEVPSVVLYRSRLQPEGPSYERLRSLRLLGEHPFVADGSASEPVGRAAADRRR